MSNERVWITADTHFQHEGVIKHCNRPFKSVQEMNEQLIKNWNELVDKKDHVYILGDFAFKDHLKFIMALKGRKHLIIGSHDGMSAEVLKHFVTVNEMKQIKYKGRYFCLTHCPMRTWEDCFRGNVHLHGHCHGRLISYNLSFDVGVDTHNYKPYNMDEILEIVKKREIEMIKSHRILEVDGKRQYYQDDVRYLEYLLKLKIKNEGGVKCQ